LVTVAVALFFWPTRGSATEQLLGALADYRSLLATNRQPVVISAERRPAAGRFGKAVAPLPERAMAAAAELGLEW
jgi:hypothetical protein